jgi:tRNA 2-thiouridine synthesizing protein B
LNKCDLALVKQCLGVAADGDAILLLEEGVYAALTDHVLGRLLLQRSPAVTLAALKEDLAARGISARIPADFSVVSYAEFVALSLAHARVVSWH